MYRINNLIICIFGLLTGWSCALSGQIPTVGLFTYEPGSYNGYTLMAPQSSDTTYLIDNCGRVIHKWSSSYRPGNMVYLLENGDLLRTCRLPNNSFSSGGGGGRIERISWDDQLVWSWEYTSTSFLQHHDIEPMPNGNILVLAWEYRSGAEAIDAGRDPSILTQGELWPEHIVEVEPVGSDSGRIVWEWHLFDHIIQDFDNTKDNFGVVADHPELLDLNYVSGVGVPDWVHANAIDYNPELDQIMICSRKMAEIYVIDHSTTTAEAAGHTGGNSGKGGDFLYRWGNPLVYDRGDATDKVYYAPHDAHWIPTGFPDAGKIMIFNNGLLRPEGDYSSVDIIDPPVDQNGHYTIDGSQPFGPQQLFYHYAAPVPDDFYSPRISGAQQLPNGNVLACSGVQGWLFEVDQQKELVWEYRIPIDNNGIVIQGNPPLGNTLFRAYRLPVDDPRLVGLELSPGLPIEKNPFPDSCKIHEPIAHIHENIISYLKIFPNPAGDHCWVECPDAIGNSIEVYALTGKKVFRVHTSLKRTRIYIGDLPPGMYFVKIGDVATEKLIISR